MIVNRQTQHMQLNHLCYSVAVTTLCTSSIHAQNVGAVAKPTIIWDVSRIEDRDQCRIEFPDLIRFRGHWYCVFREGLVHGNDDSGRARLIRSADGENWESVTLFEWKGGDVRDPRLSITPEGALMINSSIYFLSHRGTPNSELEHEVTRQSVTWLSRDGETWSTAHACPTGVNNWRWDVTWYGGMGYSVAYTGKDGHGALYRTRDGRSWRMLKDGFFPESGGTEAALAFPNPNLAICLARQPSTKDGVVDAKLGIGRGPTWQAWEWMSLKLDWNDGKPTDAKRGVATFAGPKLLVLSDGRLVATGRNLGLWLVEPETARLTKFAEPIGNSYPGLVEYDGKLWMTAGTAKVDAVVFGAFKMPTMK